MMNSFTDLEHKFMPPFRRQLAAAESTEDVKKFFAQLGRDFLSQAVTGLDVSPVDVRLEPESTPAYAIDEQILETAALTDALEHSDLSHIIARFADAAVHRYRHLQKNPEKTERKIYHRHRG